MYWLSALVLATPIATQAAPLTQPGRTCHLPGVEEGLRCVTVTVPSNYEGKNKEQVKLHVTIAPSFRENAKPDPVFILAGGPGQGGSDVLGVINRAFHRLRATRDLVFIDQRGTGMSGKLDCKFPESSHVLSDAEALAELKSCIDSQNKPYADYTTANAARDIESVRKELHYGPINVWGGSYGTRLGQAYARLYPTSVRTLVLDGVAPPEQVIPASGKDAQAALELLFSQCEKDKACTKAFPQLREEFDALLKKTTAGKIGIDINDPRTAKPLHVDMDFTRFVSTIHSILYSADDSRRLPYLIDSAFKGRWEPFIARRNASADFSADASASMSALLHLAVVCAEDVPRLTPAMADEDAKASFMGATMTRRYQGTCGVIHVPAVNEPAPARIDVPVLLLSGGVDPVTPPRRAEAAMKTMSHAQHLVVPQAGHGISNLGCAPKLVRAFLDKPDAKVDGDCLKEIPTPTFQLNAAGPQP